MTDVKNSRLYKTLKKAVRKEDHAELLRMLEMVPMEANLDLDAGSIISAFVWTETPQGQEYWWDLHRRLRGAGHEC